jgi:hypothetical protein
MDFDTPRWQRVRERQPSAVRQRRAAGSGARGPDRVLTTNAQGQIVLPPGTSLADVTVEGRNIVIVADDGTRYVITDGAIFVPQLVADGVAVPPINLAALLLGNERNRPRARRRARAAISPALSERSRPPTASATCCRTPSCSSAGPGARGHSRTCSGYSASTIIITPNNPAGAVAATASVREDGLPARGSEPPGSNSAANSETTTGTIVFSADDGLQSITLNGVAITGIGQTFTTSKGVLTITSMAPGPTATPTR